MDHNLENPSVKSEDWIKSWNKFKNDRGSANKELSKIQKDLKMQNATNLVLFHDAVSDVLKIARILQTTQGHAVLVGVGGTGKRSLSRLASHVAGVQLHEMEGDCTGDATEFHDKMKSLSIEAGVKNNVIAFMLSEEQLVNPVVLENCNIDSNIYSGLAFGLGIERIAMLKHGVTDIREFYKSNLDFLSQFK